MYSHKEKHIPSTHGKLGLGESPAFSPLFINKRNLLIQKHYCH